jgi:putative flippase GtrA
MTAAHRRLLKFCFVGAIGIGVQLGLLTMLRRLQADYLAATGLAVEGAVIHNFLWHRRFTWVDRTQGGVCDFFQSLLRFHLSNGLISLFGNVALVHILVGKFELPVFAANIAAIALCFVVNFPKAEGGQARERAATPPGRACIREAKS